MPKIQLKWDPRAGPILVVVLGKRQLGLALFCHRKEERCIKIFGHTAPLCSRCMGILIGAISACLLGTIGMVVPLSGNIILIVPLLVDGFTQLLDMRQSNNILRLVTGFLFSIGLLMLMK